MSTIFTSRFSVRFVKSVSVVAIAAALAGCASDTVRFSDGFYTGAVPQQGVSPVQTPFPENAPVQPYQPPSAHTQAPPTGLDYTHTSSVPQNSAVQRQQLATPTAAATNLESIKTATPKPQAVASAATKTTPKKGWNAVGGTMVTMGANDNIDTLAKRYGVPAKEIAKANGLSRTAVVAGGTKLIIPVYNADGVKTSSTAAIAPATATNVPVPNTRPLGTEVASLAPSIAASAAPTVANGVAKSGKYVVSSGDTLSRIAAQTGASVSSIERLNGLSSDNLQIGQSLLIPGFAGNPDAASIAAKPANVDPITTGNSAAANKKVVAYTPPKVKVKTNGSIATIDQSSTASAPADTGVDKMRWPAKGRVVSGFGSNVGGKGNNGIDISVPKGTAIKAAENGVVIYAGDGLKEFGKTVLVRHGNGLVTVYGHLDAIKVARGENIKRGQSVGASGMTGSAKQPQLHFEVRKNTTPVNPTTYLN